MIMLEVLDESFNSCVPEERKKQEWISPVWGQVNNQLLRERTPDLCGFHFRVLLEH